MSDNRLKPTDACDHFPIDLCCSINHIAVNVKKIAIYNRLKPYTASTRRANCMKNYSKASNLLIILLPKVQRSNFNLRLSSNECIIHVKAINGFQFLC